MMYPHDLQHSKLSHDKLKVDLTLKTKIMISVTTINKENSTMKIHPTHMRPFALTHSVFLQNGY